MDIDNKMFANVFSVSISKVLMLCLFSCNMFGQSFSIDNPDIHIVSGTIVVFDAELKLPAEHPESSIPKVSTAKKRSYKVKTLSVRLKSKSFKKKADKPEDDQFFLAGGPGSSYAFGLYKNTSSAAVLAGSQFYKFISATPVFCLLLLVNCGILMLLYLRYSSVSLTKISALLCRRPPPFRL